MPGANAAPAGPASGYAYEMRNPTQVGLTVLRLIAVLHTVLLWLPTAFIGATETRVVVTAALGTVLNVAFVWWLTAVPEVARPAAGNHLRNWVWITAHTIPVAGLVALSPEGAYAAISLYFYVLWLLPTWVGATAVAIINLFVVLGQFVHHGVTVGGIVGPTISVISVVVLASGLRWALAVAQRNAELLAELERTSAELAEAQHTAGVNAEHARRARELHDSTAQDLASIRLLLSAAQTGSHQGAADQDPEQLVRQASDLSRSALSNIRAIINRDRPAELTDRTLPDALAHLCERAAAQPDAPAVSFHHDGANSFAPMSTQLALYRITQELLANVIKHAGAAAAEVRLSIGAHSAVLTVSDDGRGFSLDEALSHRSDGTGLGLKGIKSRVAELGGTVGIVTDPGDGTLVRIDVPVQTERQGER